MKPPHYSVYCSMVGLEVGPQISYGHFLNCSHLAIVAINCTVLKGDHTNESPSWIMKIKQGLNNLLR